jgi:hypothetical protein
MRRIIFILLCFLGVLGSFGQPTNVFIGTRVNDNTGDSAATAYSKLNANDTWLYNLIQNISVSGGGDKVATNNGTAWGLTLQTSVAVPFATGSKIAVFDSGKHLTNSQYADTDFPLAVNGSVSGLTVSDGTARRGILWDASKKFTPDTTVIYAKLFCAADGTTDDTTALGTTAVGAVPTGGILDLGGATYAVTSLSIAKSDFKIRNGTIKFSATNGTGVVITGNDWSVDGVNVDGNSKAVAGYFVNNGSKRWAIKNSVIKNIYGDDVIGAAVVTGIFIKRGVQSGTISDCVITNVTHATNGTRVSRAVALTDFGYSGTNDQVLDITISRNKFYNIGAGEFGDCVALNMQRSYSSRVIVSDCQGVNFGQRFGKVEAAGTIWRGNFVESYSNNEIGSLAFSGFSFYGPTNQCNNNTIIGNFSLGIEFGSYSAGFEAYYGQANGNVIIFNTANSATNGIGIDFTQRAYDLQADGNIVLGGKYAARLHGDVRNCQLGLTLATNQLTAGIVSETDGTNAPSHCDLGDLRIQSSLASYGFNITAGTNINTGLVRGTVVSSLRNRAIGVTGTLAAEIDSQLATASSLMKFDSQLRAINADLTGDVTTAGGVAATLAASGVTAATYGDATHVGQFAVDAKGRITAASNVAISGGGASDNWAASGSTNSTLPGIGMSYSLVVTNSITIGSGTTAGFDAWFDGGSHYFSISPQTMSANVNWIMPASASDGFLLGTTGATTNSTLSYVGFSGSGNVARVTGPTFVTPTLGAATATTINKVTITAPASGATLTIADGKTATVNNSITLAGTDSTTITLPTVTATVFSTAGGEINARDI